MKRLMLAYLVAAACALTACNRNSGSTSSKEAKITGSPSDPAVEIKPQWAAGQRYMMRMESAQSYQLPDFAAGRGRGGAQNTNNAPLESHFAQDYSLVVTNAPDGHRGIEMEILAYELVAARGDQEFMNYDSRNKVVPQGGPMTDVFEKLIGAKIHYLVAPDNRVVKVEGVNELFERIEPEAAAGAGGAAQRGAANAGMLRNMYNEDMFRQMIELSGAPPAAVRIGETWVHTRDATAPVIGKLTMTLTNTLRGWQEHEGRKCARVEFTGTLTMGSTSSTNPVAAFLKLENGNIVGRYWFAPDLGIATETAIEQQMTLTLPNFAAQRRRPNAENASTNAPATISAPIRQNISVKLVEVKPIDG